MIKKAFAAWILRPMFVVVAIAIVLLFACLEPVFVTCEAIGIMKPPMK